MSTIQELERKILQLEKEIQAKEQQTALLVKKAEQAVDYATHAYRVDHYGFIWVYDVNTKKYCKTEMQLHTPEVKDNSIGTSKLMDNSVVWDKLASDVRNRIESSLHNLNISPDVVLRGQQAQVQIEALCYYQADSITIKRNGMVIASGSGMSLSFTDVIIPMGVDNIEYKAEFKRGSEITNTISSTLKVAQPIYYGAGATYDAATCVAPARISPAGEYGLSVDADGSYLFFLVPDGMVINRATMNGMQIPIQDPESILLNGYPYKSYRSTLQYNQFSDTIVIS